MAQIELLQPTEKIKDSYGKINEAISSLNSATSAATPNTIVERDGQGRFKAAAPDASDDVARKAEVDAKLSLSGGTMTGRLEFSGNQMGLRFRNGDSDTSAEFDFPEASTANVTARIFRFTNTSGNKQFTLARGDGTANPAFTITNGAITRINEIVVTITAYAGNPNGNVAAPPGSICLNTSGGAGSSIYVKESGTGNTGWVAK